MNEWEIESEQPKASPMRKHGRSLSRRQRQNIQSAPCKPRCKFIHQRHYKCAEGSKQYHLCRVCFKPWDGGKVRVGCFTSIVNFASEWMQLLKFKIALAVPQAVLWPTVTEKEGTDRMDEMCLRLNWKGTRNRSRPSGGRF